MKSAYFDVAYLAKLYWCEPDSDAVASLASRYDVLACCLHGRAEFAAVGHRKLREGSATLAQARAILHQLNAEADYGAVQWLPLDREVITLCEEVLSRHHEALFLRSGDAIHLACAKVNGFAEIYSNDRHRLAAAAAVGVVGRSVADPACR